MNQSLEDEVIDLTLGAQRINHSKAAAKKLLKLLSDELLIEKPLIEKALNNKDWQSLKNIIHRRLGALSYCGAPRLERTCRQLYQALILMQQTKIVSETQYFLSEIDAFQMQSAASKRC